MVRAGEVAFAVITRFARLPVPGEHVWLSLSEGQRAQLGAEYGYGRSRNWLPAIVRETVLRQEDHWKVEVPHGTSSPGVIWDHVADVFAVAITTEAWHEKLARWTPGGDTA